MFILKLNEHVHSIRKCRLTFHSWNMSCSKIIRIIKELIIKFKKLEEVKRVPQVLVDYCCRFRGIYKFGAKRKDFFVEEPILHLTWLKFIKKLKCNLQVELLFKISVYSFFAKVAKYDKVAR